jgi:ATP-dependent DNA ligase
LQSLPKKDAAFIEPMECLAVPKLFDHSEWIYEIKLDAYRAVAAKSDRAVRLYSRHNQHLAHEGPRFVDLASGKN